jgi:carbamoyltransferase
MNIIGISAFYHDSSIALIQDGILTYASQEERFSRIKHDDSFPSLALSNCLEEMELSLGDIEAFVFYEKPFLTLERLLETYLNYAPKGFYSFAKAFPLWSKSKIFQKRNIIKYLKKIDHNWSHTDRIYFCEHHTSHAASSYYPSPFSEAIILTMDGVGEWATTSVHHGDGRNLSTKEEIHFPHSLGLFYSAMTQYAGFKVNSGEYKLMGLAPHGEPVYADCLLEQIFTLYDDGSFRLNAKYFDYLVGLKMTNSKMQDLLGFAPRTPHEPIRQQDKDLAASTQKVLEAIVLKLVKRVQEKYPLENLCLAGGVALNCVLNSKIKEAAHFKNVWVQPASGDAGGAVGAAYYFWHQYLNKSREVSANDKMNWAYLGPSFSAQQVKNDLDLCQAVYSHQTEVNSIKVIAQDLSRGLCIGWFQGAMEFGPRALGHRSILADPRNCNMQQILNEKIKYRESFRPFAPIVLKDLAHEWFSLTDSPYMLFTANIKNHGLAEKVPAVVHVDLSARIQTLSREANPLLYDLIYEFYQQTGVPMLINTSFNVRGEPIVCSPADAYRCFMGSGLDALFIENFLLYKKSQLKPHNYGFHRSFPLD